MKGRMGGFGSNKGRARIISRSSGKTSKGFGRLKTGRGSKEADGSEGRRKFHCESGKEREKTERIGRRNRLGETLSFLFFSLFYEKIKQ
jgi:hypothetical protein